MFHRPLAIALLLGLGASLHAQEWTRFRGPNGSGISDAKTVPTKWTEEDYNWKIALPGDGHGSPVIWGEKIFVLAMLASIAFNYVTGLWVDAEVRRGRGKLALICSVFGNLAFLGVYKYADFFVNNWNLLTSTVGIDALKLTPPHIELPIGISFFTFQAMSYVIDVYRRETPVNRNPLDIALYVALFPQLIAGPIVRYTDVAAEIASVNSNTGVLMATPPRRGMGCA